MLTAAVRRSPGAAPILRRQFLPAAAMSTAGLDKSKRSSLKPLKTKQHGVGILHDPLWNKGMAMDVSERDRLNLRGLIPPRVKTLTEQVTRSISQIREFGDDNISKNMYLQELHNRNETLYHRVLVDYIEEVAPLVYTPTVGHVCQQFGNQFRRARGMYFSANDRGQFASMSASAGERTRTLRISPRAANVPTSISGSSSVELAARRRARDRGHRRLAHPRAGRPGRSRHGHPDRQARPLLRRRRHRAPPRHARDARRGDQQRGTPAGRGVCGDPAAAPRGRGVLYAHARTHARTRPIPSPSAATTTATATIHRHGHRRRCDATRAAPRAPGHSGAPLALFTPVSCP